MLTHVHVKNMALIDEAEVEFGPGLNVLTGETGAGKSILIGSVGMALGKKTSRDVIREGADHALAELVFEVEDSKTIAELAAMDIVPEDGQIIISRRLQESRSICKINGEICTAAAVRKAAALLLDIHGQHEHQSLLYTDRQLDYLDDYGQEETARLKKTVAEDYARYRACRKELDELSLDEEQKKRQLDFLEFEVNEIEEAALKKGEDEELEIQFRRMLNSQKITEALTEVYAMTGYEEMHSAGSMIGYAMQRMQAVTSLDERLEGLSQTISDIDGLINDFNRDLSDYMSELTFSEEEFAAVGDRLNLINHLKEKYGNTFENIQKYAEEKRIELDKLKHYEEYKAELEQKCKAYEKTLTESCDKLSEQRKKSAAEFEKKLTEHLQDLNFNDVRFRIRFEKTQHFSANGTDSITFLISTNPGEPMRELAAVVSGGELSRIMLGIRTLLAEQEHTGTLIFDEIDTGISGRTAQKVAEKMALISRGCQVLCITHLPQIAAMADCHFEIEKSVENGVTRTSVRKLQEEETCEELARMLGGTQITDAVYENAREMKRLAGECKGALEG